MKESEYHPLCLAFPLNEKLVEDLAEDIKKNGLVREITRYQGKILDGRHRYLACKKVNVNPRYIDLPSEIDPKTYVVSQNLKRRDLTPIEKIEVALKLDNWNPLKEKIKSGEDERISILTQRKHDKKIAREAHATSTSVRKVKEIQKISDSNPKIQKQIEELKKDKSISIDILYKKAKQPEKTIKQIKKEKKIPEIIKDLQECLRKKEQENIVLKKIINLIKEKLIERKIWDDVKKEIYSIADSTKINLPTFIELRKAELI